jgi:hypothetical protein
LKKKQKILMNKNKDLCDLIKIVKLIEHHNSFDFGFSDSEGWKT